MSNNMSNDPDDLDKLWQQQDTSTVDVTALRRQWKLMRLKQYLYIAIDGLALLAIPLVMFLLPKELSSFEFIWLSSLFMFMTGWFVFMLWLRRFSLGFGDVDASTQDYVYRVKIQYRQNIRIAHLNKIFCYVVPFIFLSYLVAAYLGEFVSNDALLKKAKLLLGYCAVFLPPCWIWAHKREQKFKQLLANFDARWVA